MSTIDYDPLDEEEAFTATSLNAGFTTRLILLL